jgi:predicted phosphodiesterase
MDSLLVLSDGHANPHALNEIVAFAEKITRFQVRYLGDIWGYGYDSVTFYKEIMKLDPNWNAGNHDIHGILAHHGELNQWLGPKMSEIATATDALHIKKMADAKLEIPSIEQIRAREKPRSEVVGNFRLVFVHASLQNFGENYSSQYLIPNDKYKPPIHNTCHIAFTDFPPPPNGKTIIFTGHSHLPMLTSWNENNQLTFHQMAYATTTNGNTPPEAIFDCTKIADPVILVNGGSVSMMRDGVTISNSTKRIFRAHGILFDSQTGQLRFLQAQYPASKILAELRAMYEELTVANRETISKQLADIYAQCFINGDNHYYAYTPNGFVLP